jgi:hypothetical protein
MMKKRLKTIIALAMCAVMVAAIPFSVGAHAENSYTYNYDYWGEFTDSPDMYSIASVTTASMLGIDSLKNPKGMTVANETIYICDTGNNRIVIAKRAIEGEEPKKYQPQAATEENANPEEIANVTVTTPEEGVTPVANEITEVKVTTPTTEPQPVNAETVPNGKVKYTSDLYVIEDGVKDHFTVDESKYPGKTTDITTFNGPTDIAISEDGNIFICDNANHRIVKVDKDWVYMGQFNVPVDSTFDANAEFLPNKIVVDTAERVYCIATNVNKGLIKYEADFTFSGFVGATPVTYNFWDWLWKKFASQEQRNAMANFVPTQYDNLYMDKEGFIYVCTYKPSDEDVDSGAADVVRKLNLLGSDILVRNGSYAIYGDLYMGGTGSAPKGKSEFADITTLDNDIYICLDQNRGRLFIYDDQGHLVCAFGGKGNMNGYFNRATSIDHINGKDLIVLDESDSAITLFTTTEYGNLIYDAIDQFDLGEYDESEKSWRKVMELNGNYDLAYIGVGRSLLRQKKYKEAMEYFELKHDAENYSKAFKQYRKQWVEDNIVLIVIVVLLLFLVPLGIGKLKSIKHEIDTADIFQL